MDPHVAGSILQGSGLRPFDDTMFPGNSGCNAYRA
jgi:hypothetical protein